MIQSNHPDQREWLEDLKLDDEIISRFKIYRLSFSTFPGRQMMEKMVECLRLDVKVSAAYETFGNITCRSQKCPQFSILVFAKP